MLRLVLLLLLGTAVTGEEVMLETLDLSTARQGFGRPQINRSIRETPLSVAGRTATRGLGSHAAFEWWLELGGGSTRFTALVGVDDNAQGPGSVSFRVVVDGETKFDSGVMRPGDAAKAIDVDLVDAQQMVLLVNPAGDGVSFDHADWLEPTLVVTGAAPRAIRAADDPPIILTPPPGPAPRLNNALVYGCRPGRPFLYRIPAQGQRPLRFRATDLPRGLSLDGDSGIIRGTAPLRGEYTVQLQASNIHGSDRRDFRIVAGDQIALTPPMGWNDWYAHYDRITDAMVREAADVLVSSGLADVGYSYVSIDDCWANSAYHGDERRRGPARDEAGNILANSYFPDMPALTAYLHERGLKAGIYTSPGPTTCAGFTGSYEHEAQDVRTFAEWGFDLLKYDWCSYGSVVGNTPTLEQLRAPYQQVGALLEAADRDIVYNLCQYGMGDVWTWGRTVGGQSWRTGGDLGFELENIFEIALRNCALREWNGPGGWNDPDYVQIGRIGAALQNGLPGQGPLSPTEEYSFMSLWALMAAPIFYSGDLAALDPFTLNVLGNAEVIAINQDPLGQCAEATLLDDDTFVLVKELADGTRAVGLANRGLTARSVAVDWAQLGLTGVQQVRDVWRQQSQGLFVDRYETNVPRRGVALLVFSPLR